MKFFNKILFPTLMAVGCFALSVTSILAQQSIDGNLDISLLMKEASVRLDMSNEDAVILFDSERIRLNKDSRYTKYNHRIIWINAKDAFEHYGNIRVPYDPSRCSLHVETVRTWRDNKWSVTDLDAIEKKLPEALSNADDYINIHEAILSHEKIEFPYILEITYSIEDKEPFRRGWDGSWTFVRDEPVIKSWFGFELPIGWWPNIYEFPGAPAPFKSTDETLGLDMYSWERGPYQAKTFPPPENIEDNESFIIWSTWRDWSSLGAFIRSNFDSVAAIDTYLEEQLDSLLKGTFTNREKARLIASYVGEKTTFIDYPWKYWLPEMRPAGKTILSAYGHALDRTILAAALLSKAKIKTLPVFTCSDFGNINTNVPGLTQLSNIGLWLSGDNLAAYYEPTKSEIKSGPLSFFSRMAWLAGNDEQPAIRINGTEKSSLNNVRIDLFYDEGKKRFVGTGFCSATNYFNQYQRMSGMKNEAFEYFEELVSSVFKNAKLISCNPLGEFKILNSVFSFHFEIESLSYDDDKILLNLGESNCGIFANLPENTELFHNQRTSPIHLPCQMSQNIKLNLDLNGLDLISYPEDKLIKNEAGNFGITSKITEKKLTITRSLTLAKIYYTGEEWLQFRTLLLADRNENNRLILIDED